MSTVIMPPLITVVGSLNMDLVVQVGTLPTAGQTVLGGSFQLYPGGKGANQAVAAARAGGQVVLIGCVGDDSYGTTLRVQLEADGIDQRYLLIRPDAASGMALITVERAGQNTIVVVPGANATLTEGDVEQAAIAIEATAVLLLQLETPLPTVVTAARIARLAGATVVLNPAPAQPLPGDLLALVDVLVVNETESAALSGVRPVDWASAERAARALSALGPATVVVTLGAQGALFLHQGQIQRQSAYPVQVVDTTAAGDAFVGALAVAFGEGRPLPEAVKWGAAAGALATTRQGAQPALPERNAIEALIAGADVTSEP